MARREVRCLGAAVLIAAAVSGVLILARIPSAEAMTDPFFWGSEAQRGGAGAPGPGPRAWFGGVSPPGARARLEGSSSPPGARTRPGGASTQGARARPDGAPPPPGTRARPGPGGVSTPGTRARLDGASPGAGARPEGASPPPGARARPGASPPGTRIRPDSASPPPGARARSSGGASPGAGARPDGASTAAVRARPEGASSPPGAHAPPAPGGASAGGASPQGSGARLGGACPPNPCACKDAIPQPSGKPKETPEHHRPQHHHPKKHHDTTTGGAAGTPPAPPRPSGDKPTGGAAAPPPAPPTPPGDKPIVKDTNRIMLVIGCLYSLLSFCTPIVTLWSTGRSVAATNAFYGWFDLLASALGCFGWLLFAISQLHGEDGQIIGTAAVVVNAFGFAFYATYIVVKLAVEGYMGSLACLGVMFVFLGAYIGTIIVSVYGPMKRESREATIVSAVAFVLQIISQGLPLITVCPLMWSMIFPPQNEQRPEHINTRKLTVYSRVGNFGLSLFWASYCTMTYEHDFFQLANDVGAVLSFVSMVLHLLYALRPHAEDYPPAPPPQV